MYTYISVNTCTCTCTCIGHSVLFILCLNSLSSLSLLCIVHVHVPLSLSLSLSFCCTCTVSLSPSLPPLSLCFTMHVHCISPSLSFYFLPSLSLFPQVQQLMECIYGRSAVSVDWRRLVLCLSQPYPLPSSQDLLTALSSMRDTLKDGRNDKMITRQEYMSVPTWLDEGADEDRNARLKPVRTCTYTCIHVCICVHVCVCVCTVHV